MITITPGNYGASDLVSALNTAINAACVPVLKTAASSSQTTEYYYSSFGNNGYTISGVTTQPVSLNQNTGKIIFNFPVSFSELSDAVGSTTSAYSNVNFNAHIYSGFYLLSENYNGFF